MKIKTGSKTECKNPKTYIRLILEDVAYDAKSEDAMLSKMNNYKTILMEIPEGVDTHGHRLIGCEWVEEE